MSENDPQPDNTLPGDLPDDEEEENGEKKPHPHGDAEKPGKESAPGQQKKQ